MTLRRPIEPAYLQSASDPDRTDDERLGAGDVVALAGADDASEAARAVLER